MGPVFSLVRGKILATRVDEVVATYQAALAAGPPPGIVKTYLLSDGTGTVVVATVWRDRATLDAMRRTGQEPFAPRLIREAGGEPSAEFFDVIAESAAAEG